MSSSSPRRRSGGGSSHAHNLLLLAVAIASFFAGTVVTLQTGIDKCSNSNSLRVDSTTIDPHHIDDMVQERLEALKADLPKCQNAQDSQHQEAGGPLTFPSPVGKYAAGMVRTDKLEFIDQINTGVPPDLPKSGDSEVLILYQREQALPQGYHSNGGDDESSSLPKYDAEAALQHCDMVNTILVDHSKGRNQCIAIMPQYESFHVQKWMRIPATGGKLDSTVPLRAVSRGMQTNGQDQFSPPRSTHIHQNWELLSKYFDSYDASMKELKPLVEKVATPNKTVTVMVTNFGQSELLVNFVCAANKRNLDTSSILVFATDAETKILAESLGLTAFYDERNFGEMPKEAAHHYGDSKFTAMMMAKVICVQMVNALKYNVLFQDVDIVWYKNPVEYFETSEKDFDMLFQDDGGHTVRYAPYSANSGFYFVRYSATTEYFFSSLLLAGDLILKTDSHQQALIALLSEHVSLYGLRVKVFSRDTDEFPGGYHYHQATGKYLRSFFAGDVDPYLFHMSWTLNKDNKLLFLRQMGEWFVQDQCVHKTVEESVGTAGANKDTYISTCCAAEPLFSCHYRDKPSIKPCKDSPSIDKGKPSWWK